MNAVRLRKVLLTVMWLRRAPAWPFYALGVLLVLTAAALSRLAEWIAGADWPAGSGDWP